MYKWLYAWHLWKHPLWRLDLRRISRCLYVCHNFVVAGLSSVPPGRRFAERFFMNRTRRPPVFCQRGYPGLHAAPVPAITTTFYVIVTNPLFSLLPLLYLPLFLFQLYPPISLIFSPSFYSFLPLSLTLPLFRLNFLLSARRPIPLTSD